MPAEPPALAAIGSTGLESRHASRHYYRRCGRATRRLGCLKLTAVADLNLSTHLLLAAVVSAGPGPDAAQFCEALGGGVARCRVHTPLSEATAYDAEPFYEYARRELGVHLSVFPVGAGACRGRVPPAGGPALPNPARGDAAAPTLRSVVAVRERLQPPQAPPRQRP